MNENTDFFNKIDDFIMGNLRDEELNSFELELANNEALAKAVNQQRILYESIRKSGRKEFVADLKVIHKKVVDNDPKLAKIRKFNWRPFFAAAAVLFIVASCLWLFIPASTDSQSLFVANYEPYELNQNVRDFQQDQNLLRGAELYRDKNYNESLPILEKVSEDNTSSSITMAIAISQHENGETKKAISILQKIIDADDPFLSDLAHWYSALFYLQLDQKENAITHLSILTDSAQNDKYEEAKQLLEKLR